MKALSNNHEGIFFCGFPTHDCAWRTQSIFNQYVIQAIVRPLFRRLIQTALRGKIRLVALSERDGQRWKGEPRQENKIKTGSRLCRRAKLHHPRGHSAHSRLDHPLQPCPPLLLRRQKFPRRAADRNRNAWTVLGRDCSRIIQPTAAEVSQQVNAGLRINTRIYFAGFLTTTSMLLDTYIIIARNR